MKKTIIRTVLIVIFGFTLFYTISFCSYLSKSQKEIYNNLAKVFEREATLIAAEFDAIKAQSKELAAVANPNSFSSGLPHNVISIAYLDPSLKFIYGWEEKAGGKPIPMGDFDTGKIKSPSHHWIEIDIHVARHRAYGIYLIKRKDGSYLSIKYNFTNLVTTEAPLLYTYKGFTQISRVEDLDQKVFSAPAKANLLARLENSALYFSKKVSTDLYFIYTVSWDDLYPFTPSDFYTLLTLLSLWGVLAIFGLPFILKPYLSPAKNLWLTSILFNILCLLFISLLFVDFPSKFRQISDQNLSSKKIQEIVDKAPDSSIIPTLILIESLSFPTESSVITTGFIYQIYPKDASIQMGFTFPESTIAYPTIITEIEKWETSHYVHIIWQFGASFTQSFPPTFFPFDTREINLTLWPLELKKPLIFIPKYSSYTILLPTSKPGINPHITVAGWKIDQSSFLVDPIHSYGFIKSSNTITYRYNILLSRHFLGAFLSNFLSLALCIVISFLTLFIPLNLLRKSLFAVLSVFVGILFIAATNHASLRSALNISLFAYCEYFFLSFYIVLIVLCIYFIYFARNPQKPMNSLLILTVSYWPILLGSFTLILMTSFLLVN